MNMSNTEIKAGISVMSKNIYKEMFQNHTEPILVREHKDRHIILRGRLNRERLPIQATPPECRTDNTIRLFKLTMVIAIGPAVFTEPYINT